MATVVNPNDEASNAFRRFGRLLSEYRKKKDLSQMDVAKRMGIGQSTLSGWETGRQMPDSPQVFKDYCNLLELNETQTAEVMEAWHIFQVAARETTVMALSVSPVRIFSRDDLGMLVKISDLLECDLPKDLALRIIEVWNASKQAKQPGSPLAQSDSP